MSGLDLVLSRCRLPDGRETDLGCRDGLIAELGALAGRRAHRVVNCGRRLVARARAGPHPPGQCVAAAPNNGQNPFTPVGNADPLVVRAGRVTVEGPPAPREPWRRLAEGSGTGSATESTERP